MAVNGLRNIWFVAPGLFGIVLISSNAWSAPTQNPVATSTNQSILAQTTAVDQANGAVEQRQPAGYVVEVEVIPQQQPPPGAETGAIPQHVPPTVEASPQQPPGYGVEVEAIPQQQPSHAAETEMVPQSPPQTADVEQPAAELPVHAPETEGLSQVTSVSQLSDVRPTDWAFQALQSLVERYGCIVGYPDKTYRGDRALTRYEFAAGLNACLDKIQELIAAATTDFVKREDLEIIKKLQEEFTAELASLRGRLDGLEVRTATLEKQQFSTTTKLVGEAIFAISDLFGDQVDDLNNTVFQDRVRIDLQTSFTGRDILHTRLAAGNVEQFLIRGSTLSAFVVNSAGQQQGTAEGTLTPRINGQTDNRVVLDRLDYTLPVGDRLKLYVAATGGKSQHYVHSTVNPYFEDFDGGKGSISAFSQESPIYRIGGGAGAALEVSVNDRKTVTLTAGYLATHADNPGAGQGLLNGDYAALGQLTITPSDAFQIGLTYVHAYHTAGNSIFSLGLGDNNFFTGTLPANAIHTAFGLSAVTNSYGVEASLKLAPSLVLNAFGGYTDLKLLGSGNGEIWYYGLGLALPDLFKQGNLGGVMVGVEPYLGRVNAAGFGLRDLGLRDLGLRNDTSLHIEGFYKFQVTDNISITPGVIWVTAPDQDNANSDYVVGTIRTTFSF